MMPVACGPIHHGFYVGGTITLPGDKHEAGVVTARMPLRAGFRQSLFQFSPRADTELGEDVAEMPLHGSRTKEQARPDLRVRQPVTSQFGDLPLLRRQVVPGVGLSLIHI